MRKSIEDIINEMKKEEEKDYIVEHEDTDAYLEAEIDEPEIEEEEKTYTKESLIENLFTDNTSDFIPDFEALQKNESTELLFLHLSKHASEASGVDKGNYIAINKGDIDIQEYLENMEVESLSGQPIPKGELEDVISCKLLFKVNDFDEPITQKQLVKDIKEGLRVTHTDTDDDLIFTSNAKVDYLEIVDTKFFDNRIDETLKRYKDLSYPDSVIESSLKYKELLKGNKKMVFCPIIDKEVYVFEGEA